MSRWATGRRSSASATAENAGATGAKAAARAGQRVALGDLTNLIGVGGRFGAADSAPDAVLQMQYITLFVACGFVSNLPLKWRSTKSLADTKKGASLHNVNTERGSVRKATSGEFDQAVSHHEITLQEDNVFLSFVPSIVPEGGKSPGLSEDSVSMEDAMSTCASMGSDDFDCFDDGDSSTVDTLHCWPSDKLHISDSKYVAAFDWKKHSPMAIKTENTFDIDDNQEDVQLFGMLADDIYKNLRKAEIRRRPSTNFVETTQIDMSTSMRALLIDWLVEVTEEYRLVPETLYLTVNYIDRYLSVKVISRHRLQLLGIACLLIAAKYEEICPPQVEELCYLTDDSYYKDEVLQMEASVLKYLRFEMTAPTAKCFLRRFVRATQIYDEGSTLDLEFIANYICELSLLEYSLLRYVPSLVAASSVFLAKYILMPTKNPWNSTLSYYTQYTRSELRGCVRVLHRLFCVGPGSNLPAVREKYSQHKYKFVAKKYCPPSIPNEFFQDATS